jgi:hypothetical protein
MPRADWQNWNAHRTKTKSIKTKQNKTTKTMSYPVATTTLAILALCCANGSAQAPTPAQMAFNDPTVKQLIRTNDTPPSSSAKGAARLTITKGDSSIQASNFNWNSFELENTGQKRIAAVFIDVTDSMFRDVVFDHNGSGGDNVAKSLSIDFNGENVGAVSTDSYAEFWLPARGSSFVASAAFDANKLSNVNNLFVDSTADNSLDSPKAGGGFRGELLLFTDFTNGEKVGFSGDMDPNSIAGISKGTIDSGSNWDVGGVSGAEMISGVVTILFGDGTTASGTIAADGSQGGSVAVISNDLQSAPGLRVNGISAGGSGSYSSSRPMVMVQASPGATVRVSKVEGFDPTASTTMVGNNKITVKNLVSARLNVQYPEFPVNNAKNWQHVSVTIPQSGSMDVSTLFSHDSSSKNPIAFSAVVINGRGDPTSRTAKPVRLVFSTSPTAPVAAPVASPAAAPAPVPKIVVAAPVRAPVSGGSCGKKGFSDKCRKNRDCKGKYPTSVSCRGGVCYCRNNVACGCQ